MTPLTGMTALEWADRLESRDWHFVQVDYNAIARLLREVARDAERRAKGLGLVETPHCCTICDSKKRCHVCGGGTSLACADCAIDLGATVYVCSNPACRDRHESKCPFVLRAALDAARGESKDAKV